GAALNTSAPAAAATSEEIFEAEEVAKDIVEILEDGFIEVGSAARAGETGMAVGVVNLALLRVTENAVSLGTLAEANFGLFLILGIAVGVPLQSRFSIRGFDLLDGSGFSDA
ncbi:MAG: hypothetical protein WBQ59_18600, partial [Candidatus Acidiferrum sp.]